jgi:hypothetical protein
MKKAELQAHIAIIRKETVKNIIAGAYKSEDEMVEYYKRYVDVVACGLDGIGRIDEPIEEYADFDSVPTVREELEFERDYCEEHLHPVWHFLEGKN